MLQFIKMEYIQLTKDQQCEFDICVMLIGQTQANIDPNEYYLINGAIRKENWSNNDPELIVLIGPNDIFKGLYKRIQPEDSCLSPVCWDKVY